MMNNLCSECILLILTPQRDLQMEGREHQKARYAQNYKQPSKTQEILLAKLLITLLSAD